LKMPLHLNHLTIPANRDRIYNAFRWILELHKDLVVEEICFELCAESDVDLLDQMYRFKGLKTLCLSYVCAETIPPTYKLLQALDCPELEHLAIWNADFVPPLDVDMLPKLQSLYLRLDRSSGLMGSFENDMYGNVARCTDKGIFFWVDARSSVLARGNPQLWFFDSCFDEDKPEGVPVDIDPAPLINWFVRSALFFLDFYGSSSHPESIVEIDLRPVVDGNNLRLALQAIKSIDSDQMLNRIIKAQITLHSDHCVDIAGSMPTNIRFLEITFLGTNPMPPVHHRRNCHCSAAASRITAPRFGQGPR
jgi:hypothetical protein